MRVYHFPLGDFTVYHGGHGMSEVSVGQPPANRPPGDVTAAISKLDDEITDLQAVVGQLPHLLEPLLRPGPESTAEKAGPESVSELAPLAATLERFRRRVSDVRLDLTRLAERLEI